MATFRCGCGGFGWNASVAVWHGSILFFVRFLGFDGVIGRNVELRVGLCDGAVCWVALACCEVEEGFVPLGEVY